MSTAARPAASRGVCGFCGRVGRIVRKENNGAPALGICCYRLPIAVCADCGREKPCYHARSTNPVCPRCAAIRRAPVCVDCGERRVVYRRVDGGTICAACDAKRGGRTAACHTCSTVAPLVRGRCAACRLRVRVGELAAGADPVAAAAVAPFLRGLIESENPASTLRWFYTPGFDVTRRLLAGEIPVSHQGLDAAAVEAAKPVAFLRAALVNCGVLECRDEYSASFAIWHTTAVLQIRSGTDRAHVRAYAAWEVANQLARTVARRGEASYASLKYARSLVTEAIKVVLWLHEQDLELDDLRQDLVDEWITTGATTRRRVRLFFAWLKRANVTGQLDVAWDDRVPPRDALGDEERFAILRRLLHDPTIELRDRFAGSVLLLYGKPLTHIAALSTTAVNIDGGGEVRLRLGRGETTLPDPLDQIALALRSQQLERADTNGWLLPGGHAGAHITADALRIRLKRYGIERARAGRHAALLALAGRLPASILAERIGIHQGRAAQWVRLAGATYADYVALRAPAVPAHVLERVT